MKVSKTVLSFLILLSLGLIWGTGYSIARYAMTHEVPPLGYSFWQSLGPALTITFIVLLRQPCPTYFKYSKFYFTCGAIGIAIPNTIMYYAASHLPAGILAMIVNVVPLIAYPLALSLGLEKFDWLRMIGILIAILGLSFVFIPPSTITSVKLVSWAAITLLAPISFALCSIYIAQNRPKNIDSLELSSGMLIASTLILFPLVIFTHSFYFLTAPLQITDKVILLEIILSSLGYILFFKLLKVAGPIYYSLVDTIVVIMGLFWGRVLFCERLNNWTEAAVVLLIFALLLVTQRQHITWLPAKYDSI